MREYDRINYEYTYNYGRYTYCETYRPFYSAPAPPILLRTLVRWLTSTEYGVRRNEREIITGDSIFSSALA